jgi:hypothetical protein
MMDEPGRFEVCGAQSGARLWYGQRSIPMPVLRERAMEAGGLLNDRPSSFSCRSDRRDRERRRATSYSNIIYTDQDDRSARPVAPRISCTDRTDLPHHRWM